MKRYGPPPELASLTCLVELSDGRWARWADVEALEKNRDELFTRCNTLEIHRSAEGLRRQDAEAQRDIVREWGEKYRIAHDRLRTQLEAARAEAKKLLDRDALARLCVDMHSKYDPLAADNARLRVLLKRVLDCDDAEWIEAHNDAREALAAKAEGPHI